jgi:hypothetical protein
MSGDVEVYDDSDSSGEGDSPKANIPVKRGTWKGKKKNK